MEERFTTELMFTLTNNPKFQEVAELVYWNEEEIVHCPENNEYVYAIDEGSVTQCLCKKQFLGKRKHSRFYSRRDKNPTPF